MLELIELSLPYKESFLVGLREMHAEGRLTQYTIEDVAENFADFLQQLEDKKDRTKITPDLVPGTHYWLYKDRTTFIGHLSFRHELNEYLLRFGGHIGYWISPSHRRQGYGKESLRLGLEKAREFGLKRVLVTCDETNIGSKKIIEANGGQFENALEVEGEPVRKLRYWIDLQ